MNGKEKWMEERKKLTKESREKSFDGQDRCVRMRDAQWAITREKDEKEEKVK